MIKAYLKENGVLIPANDSKDRVFCGYYVAAGYNGEEAGNLFIVLSGPVLAPAYDCEGIRINVGPEFAGMSYDLRRERWYNE